MEAFRDSIISCIQYADSKRLGSLISLCKNPKLQTLVPISGQKVRSAFSRLPPQWIDIFEAFFQCIPHYYAQEWAALFEAYKRMFNCFLRVFQASGDASMLHLLYTFCDELWLFGCKCGGDVEEAARLMNKTFTACLTDRTASLHDSRRMGVHMVFSKLLKAYFHLGQFRLAKNAILALKVCELPPLEAVAKSHAVSFHFFLAVYHFVEGEWGRALELFDYALVNCHPKALKNGQLILHFLVPLRLAVQGKYPAVELLRRYKLLHVYAELLASVASGNVSGFRQQLATNAEFFIKLGTFLCVESLEFLCCRNLVKAVLEQQQQQQQNEKSCKMPLEVLLRCWKFACKLESVEMLQLECVVANLIGMGLVKGYIAHERQFLVLSQNDPFPVL